MPDTPDNTDDERVSLHGHDPEEVLRALLAVDPNSEPVIGESTSEESPPPSAREGKKP